MGYFLFVDESGSDRGESPYEVLAGISIEDRNLWGFITKIQEVEKEYFGQRISPGKLELKGKKLLKRKTFKHKNQLPPIHAHQRTELVKYLLEKKNGENPTKEELTALGQAKIAFVERVLEVCDQFQMKAFASIISPSAKKPEGYFLRKDYAFLFERFFYFLEEKDSGFLGLVVFDELERTQCHLLIDQMARYFIDTANGRERSSRIIPEPFFVHSHLTTLIQVVDVIAYIISWGVRWGEMKEPVRDELVPLAQSVERLKFRATLEEKRLPRGEKMKNFKVWGFSYLDDLRPKNEQ